MVTWKQVGLISLGVFVAACLAVALIYIPKVEVYGQYQLSHPQKISPKFYRRDVFAQEDRARQTLATILGGLAVLGGTLLTLRSVRAAEENTRIARDNTEIARILAERSADIAFENFKIAEKKQAIDRFTAAITNFSADNTKLAQRLGGLYALEQIARESQEEHHIIMDVLTAYVRKERPFVDVGDDANNAEARKVNRTVMPDDIQQIITVIGRRNAKQDFGRPLDLSHVDLSQANFYGATLSNIDLSRTSLSGADLRGAKLGGAYLFGTDMSGADLGGAYLEGADLADCPTLMSKQLESANKEKAPKTWPKGLTFDGRPSPDPSA